ncbi:hypothetical protein Tco_0811604, partial [Tanacetum coccineum]
VVHNAVQNLGIQNVGNQNGLIVVLGIANQNPNRNGNVVAARAEGNANGNNGNQIRCYNYRGLGHFSRNCTVRPRRRDVAYLQTQLLIAQKEEAGIQLQAEEFDLMAVVGDLDEIEEVNANCILMANLQQASTSGTQTDKAPVYDSNGSTEVQLYENCYNNDIFNMFTQEEQYTELLEPIPEPHQVQQNDSNVISEVSSVEQGGGTVEQHPATIEETRAYFESLYNNLAIKVEKVNTVNHKLRETNADLTTKLARYKNQEKCFEISQEKYDKLERCYQKSVYQEQCLTKKINALHLSSEATKFVRDFKSLAIEADESLAKHKALELEIERLLRVVVSQDIMSIVQIKGSQLFDKVSEQKDTTKGTSMNTQFCKQSILGQPPSSSESKLYVVTPLPKYKGFPKIDKTHALSKPVTSNSVPTPQESKVVNNDKVIAPGMFRINPFKPYREEMYVPNKVRASVRKNPITVSQPHVITKKDINSDSNGLSSTGVDNTAKTRRPQPRSNTKNDRVPSTSKSSCSKNKEVEVKEHPRNLLLSKKHNASAYCMVLNYVNDMNSRGKKQKANVSNTKNQKKQKPKVMKPKNLKELGSKGSLASSRPSKPSTCLRWIPTRRIFAMCEKLTASSNTENKSEKSVCDNASTSNPSEPSSKGFSISTSLLGRLSRLRKQHTSIYPIVVL